MNHGDGQPTICDMLRRVRSKVEMHMRDRGAGIRDRALNEIDTAILMAKKMNARLEYYKQKENGK